MKFFIPIFLGGFISFSLFALMAALVATEDIYLEPEEETPTITIITEVAELQAAKPKHILKPPPEPPKRPSGLVNQADNANLEFALPTEIGVPEFTLPSPEVNTNFPMNYLQDSDAVPVYRELAKYPPAAAKLNLDGWVKLRFSIDRYGKVEDIQVIDALPETIFNQAAIDVLSRWKYKPKIENGKSIKQENLSVRIDFAKRR